MSHFLSIILFTPLIGALLLLLVNKQNENAIRWIANVTAFVGFVISVPLWFWYNPQGAEFQFQERLPWIPSVGAEYFIGVDGLVNLVGRICEESSFWFRKIQTGLVQNYALLMLFGVFAFVSIYLFMR